MKFDLSCSIVLCYYSYQDRGFRTYLAIIAVLELGLWPKKANIRGKQNKKQKRGHWVLVVWPGIKRKSNWGLMKYRTGSNGAVENESR